MSDESDYHLDMEKKMLQPNGVDVAKTDYADFLTTLLNVEPWLNQQVGHLVFWQEAVRAKCPEAMFLLGLCYTLGVGVANDKSSGFNWFRKGAELGNSSAMVYLGVCYKQGLGVPPDFRKAFQCYRQAADAGDVNGMFNLGCLYNKGEGVEQNREAASEWLLKAGHEAEATGRVAFMTNLGYFYSKGIAVSQNYDHAMEWYGKAAAKGSGQAMHNLANLYRDGKVGIENHQMAIEWYIVAVEAGYKACLYEFVTLLLFGYLSDAQVKGVIKKMINQLDLTDTELLSTLDQNLERMDFSVSEKRYRLVLRLYKKAAERGSALAMWLVGKYYSSISRKRPNHRRALRWYKKGAKCGEVAAFQSIASCYEYGWGVKKDLQQAKAWRERAGAMHKGSDR